MTQFTMSRHSLSSSRTTGAIGSFEITCPSTRKSAAFSRVEIRDMITVWSAVHTSQRPSTNASNGSGPVSSNGVYASPSCSKWASMLTWVAAPSYTQIVGSSVISSVER